MNINKEKISNMIKDLEDMSTRYMYNTLLYMKINTVIRLLKDIKSTVDFIEEKDNDK